jgi:hypothetical protein
MTHHFLLVLIFLASLFSTNESALGQKHDRNSYLGKSPPELVSESHHWIGTSAPLTLAKLKGQVVWLHFNF